MIGKKRLCAFLCAVLTLTQVVPVFAATNSSATKLKSSMFDSWSVSDDFVYNGEAQVKEPILKDVSGNALVKGTDYELTYLYKGKTVSQPDVDLVNAGKIKVKITGKNDYKGTLTKTYTIAKYDISTGDDIAVNYATPFKFGDAPFVAVTFKGEALDKTSVTVKATGYNKVGEKKAKVVVKGKGNFKGTRTDKDIDVEKKSLADANVTVNVKDVVLVSSNNVVKKGKKNLSKVAVKIGKKTVAASNYTVKYYVSGTEVTASSNFAQYAAGTKVDVVVTAKDGKNFVDAAAGSYYLSGSLLKAKDVKAVADAKYSDGMDAKTLITVKDVAADQYDVEVIDAKAAGSTKTKVKLQITGKGVVGGTVVKTFKFAKATE